jgi:hypothetical protein
VIEDNTVILSPPAGTYPVGISLAAGFWLNQQGETIQDVIIANNYVEGPMEAGLYIASGSVGSNGNLIENVQVIGNHIKQTTPVRDNGAGLDAVIITTGDGATSYGHPETIPVIYPDDNIIRNVWLIKNVLEGSGRDGINVNAGCCGAQRNTIEGIHLLGNEVDGIFPGSGDDISGVYVLAGGSGPGDAQTTAENRISGVYIQQNTIQLTNQRTGFGGQEFISGGVVVSAGAQSLKNSVQDIWIISNEISTPVAGINLLGGWSLQPDFIATDNTLSTAKILCNTINPDLSMLQPFFPDIRGINLAGGYGPSQGNRLTDIVLQQNMVAGVADAVSVYQNAGPDSTGNLVEYPTP